MSDEQSPKEEKPAGIGSNVGTGEATDIGSAGPATGRRTEGTNIGTGGEARTASNAQTGSGEDIDTTAPAAGSGISGERPPH